MGEATVSAGAVRRGPLAALRGVLDRPLASYYLLLSSAGLLLVIGLVMVFSATSVQAYQSNGNAWAPLVKQATFSLIGLAAFWAFQRLPAGTYRNLAFPVLVTSVVLLIALDVIGLITHALGHRIPGPIHADPGNANWLYIGPLQMQPSELAKLGLALWGAHILASRGQSIGRLRALAIPLFPITGIVLLLVGINDFGTMACLFVLFVGLLWAAGVRLRFFGGMAATALVGVLALLVMPGRDYRVDRLTAFRHTGSCTAEQLQNECYQAVHGMYAIANGGWFGVGLGQGRLKWGYLPEGHNDFIFAIIAEELGVVGCFVVLALFAVITYSGLRIARRVDDPFRRIAACAVTTWLAGQALINIGGVTGLLPITGVPLPFISVGGTALVVTLAAVGLLASFARAEPDAARALHARPPDRWVRLLWAPLPALPPTRKAGVARRGRP
jgi:cell division protein FtsW